MPAFERKYRWQAAVLWPANGYDQHGQPVVGAAEQIRCQPLDMKRRQLVVGGNTITTDGRLLVSKAVAIGSRIWFGELADLSGEALSGLDLLDVLLPAPPFDMDGESGEATLTDVMETVSYDEPVDLKNRNRMYVVDIMLYRNSVTV